MHNKILILIDSLTCGGAEKSLISLLPFLVERGYDITLMLRARGGLFEQYVPKEVNIVDFPYKPSRFQRLRYSLALRMPWNKSRHSAEIYWQCIGRHYPKLNKKYDIAIAYQQGFPTFYIAEKVNASKKIAWVNVDLKAARYSNFFCYPIYKEYDKIVVVSYILGKQFLEQGFFNNEEKIVVIRDILNEGLIRKMSLMHVEFEPGLHLTTVGRLVPQKGYDLAISAAKILKDRGCKFKWHFVGGGMKQQLEELSKIHNVDDCVVFEGEQLNPYPYIANCDIYVQTSKFEGFGLTIGEAKILGKPIVSTNFPVVYNQIQPEENGLVVEMTSEAIASGIMRLIDDKGLRDRLQLNVMAEHNTTAQTESAKVISLIEG